MARHVATKDFCKQFVQENICFQVNIDKVSRHFGKKDLWKLFVKAKVRTGSPPRHKQFLNIDG